MTAAAATATIAADDDNDANGTDADDCGVDDNNNNGSCNSSVEDKMKRAVGMMKKGVSIKLPKRMRLLRKKVQLSKAITKESAADAA